MSVYIVELSITDELVVKTFIRLCDAEVKKRLDFTALQQGGLQDGYIFCLYDLFGQVNDQTHERNYNAGKSYLHIIERIMNEEPIICLCGELAQKQGAFEIEDMVQIDNIVKQVVYAFFVNHRDDMLAAIKCL